MSITTIDGALAGAQPPVFFTKGITATLVAGRHASLWPLAGFPGAGAYDTTLAGVALSGTSAQVNGQLPFADPVSGNSYLARFQGAATQAGTLILADRLWHNQLTINSTGAQTVTSATFPARDNAGSTNGAGVQLAVEVEAACGAQNAVISVSYTNQAGTASRTGSFVYAPSGFVSSAAIGAFLPIALQAGDTGVRSVETATFSTAWTTGTVHLVAYRPLVALELPAGLTPNAVDAITSGFPRMFNGTVPFLVFIPSTTTASVISGQMVYTQG